MAGSRRSKRAAASSQLDSSPRQRRSPRSLNLCADGLPAGQGPVGQSSVGEPIRAAITETGDAPEPPELPPSTFVSPGTPMRRNSHRVIQDEAPETTPSSQVQAGHPYPMPISSRDFEDFVRINSVPVEDRPELARFAQMPGTHREMYMAWNLHTIQRQNRDAAEARVDSFTIDRDLEKNIKAGSYQKVLDPTIPAYDSIEVKPIRKAVVRSVTGDTTHMKTAAAKTKIDSAIKLHVTQAKAALKRAITGHRVKHSANIPLDKYVSKVFKGRRSGTDYMARAAIFRTFSTKFKDLKFWAALDEKLAMYAAMDVVDKNRALSDIIREDQATHDRESAASSASEDETAGFTEGGVQEGASRQDPVGAVPERVQDCSDNRGAGAYGGYGGYGGGNYGGYQTSGQILLQGANRPMDGYRNMSPGHHLP